MGEGCLVVRDPGRVSAGVETTTSPLLFCAIAQLSRMTAQGGRLEPQIPLQD